MCDNNNKKNSCKENNQCCCGRNPSLDAVYDNNECLQNIMESIKCGLLNFVASVSDNFYKSGTVKTIGDRELFNAYIEGLITSMHQACTPNCGDYVSPSFSLYIQKYDLSGNPVYDLGKYDDEGAEEIAPTLGSLFPTKLSIMRDCSSRSMGGNEILYYYIPSFQLLFDPTKSNLKVKIGSASYSTYPSPISCVFPGAINPEIFTYHVHDVVLESEDSVWEEPLIESHQEIYAHMQKLLAADTGLVNLVVAIDTAIKRCIICERSIKTRMLLDKMC